MDARSGSGATRRHRVSGLRLGTLGRVALGLVCAGVLVPGANADAVDMTGTWSVGSAAIPQAGVLDVTQSGNTLAATWTPTATPAVVGSGTINAATGVFALDFGPFTAAGAPPGPAMVMNGAVAAGALTWTGQGNTCVYEVGLGWGCLTTPITGTRTSAAAACGNGFREPGEACDGGLRNNGHDNCCRTDCTLEDLDGDGVCNVIDLCPSIPGGPPDDDGDAIGDACDSRIEPRPDWGMTFFDRVRIRVPRPGSPRLPRLEARGRIYGLTLAVPTGIQVRDGLRTSIDPSILPGWADRVCHLSGTRRLRCVGGLGQFVLDLRPGTSPTETRLRLRFSSPGLVSPLGAPVVIALEFPTAIRTGLALPCNPLPSGGVVCVPFRP